MTLAWALALVLNYALGGGDPTVDAELERISRSTPLAEQLREAAGVLSRYPGNDRAQEEVAKLLAMSYLNERSGADYSDRQMALRFLAQGHHQSPAVNEALLLTLEKNPELLSEVAENASKLNPHDPRLERMLKKLGRRDRWWRRATVRNDNEAGALLVIAAQPGVSSPQELDRWEKRLGRGLDAALSREPTNVQLEELFFKRLSQSRYPEQKALEVLSIAATRPQFFTSAAYEAIKAQVRGPATHGIVWRMDELLRGELPKEALDHFLKTHFPQKPSYHFELQGAADLLAVSEQILNRTDHQLRRPPGHALAQKILEHLEGAAALATGSTTSRRERFPGGEEGERSEIAVRSALIRSRHQLLTPDTLKRFLRASATHPNEVKKSLNQLTIDENFLRSFAEVLYGPGLEQGAFDFEVKAYRRAVKAIAESDPRAMALLKDAAHDRPALWQASLDATPLVSPADAEPPNRPGFLTQDLEGCGLELRAFRKP